MVSDKYPYKVEFRSYDTGTHDCINLHRTYHQTFQEARDVFVKKENGGYLWGVLCSYDKAMDGWKTELCFDLRPWRHR